MKAVAAYLMGAGAILMIAVLTCGPAHTANAPISRQWLVQTLWLAAFVAGMAIIGVAMYLYP